MNFSEIRQRRQRDLLAAAVFARAARRVDEPEYDGTEPQLNRIVGRALADCEIEIEASNEALIARIHAIRNSIGEVWDGTPQDLAMRFARASIALQEFSR